MEATELPKKSTAYRLEQLAFALMDRGYDLQDEKLSIVADQFHAQIEDNLENEKWSWDLGVTLYNVLNQAASQWVSLTDISRIRFPYRDDNRLVWASEEWGEMEGAGSSYQETVRKHVSVMEMINELDSELVDVDHDEIWVLQSELFPYEDHGVSYNEMEGVEPISDSFHYPEWDYRVQLNRPNWVTLYEHRAKKGDPELYDQILEQNKGIAHHEKHHSQSRSVGGDFIGFIGIDQ